ncbi:MAG: hypothetical protein RR310_00610 [Eubacterium sp.]
MKNKMKILKKIGKIIGCFFGITFIIYWFNLDSKLVHKLFPILETYYDRLPRDRRL